MKAPIQDIIDAGYDSVVHPLTTKMVKHPLRGLSSREQREQTRYWRKGRRIGIKHLNRKLHLGTVA